MFHEPVNTAPMLLVDSVVSVRSRDEIANLSGSLLRRAAKSASVQPRRSDSSAMIRSALASAVSWRNWPEWAQRPGVAPWLGLRIPSAPEIPPLRVPFFISAD